MEQEERPGMETFLQFAGLPRPSEPQPSNRAPGVAAASALPTRGSLSSAAPLDEDAATTIEPLGQRLRENLDDASRQLLISAQPLSRRSPPTPSAAASPARQADSMSPDLRAPPSPPSVSPPVSKPRPAGGSSTREDLLQTNVAYAALSVPPVGASAAAPPPAGSLPHAVRATVPKGREAQPPSPAPIAGAAASASALSELPTSAPPVGRAAAVSASAPMNKSASGDSKRRTLLLAATVAVVSGITAVTWLRPSSLAQLGVGGGEAASETAGTEGRSGPTSGAPASAAASPASTGAPDPLLTRCLRPSSQTIASEERDKLLRQAVEAYDNGRHADATSALSSYIAQACDGATLEALRILERRQPSKKGKTP